MSRIQRVAITAAILASITLTVAGAAEASSHHHKHGHHGHAGTDVYSSHHPERYGHDHGPVQGLLWVVGHIL